MRILLLEKSYRRVSREIARIAPHAQPILMRDDGTFVQEGGSVECDVSRFEVAWASRDLYLLDLAGTVREFMVCVLKGEGVRWFHSGGAGVEHPVFGMIEDKGATLTNSNAGSVAIAEYVLASVLDVFQPQPARRAAQAKRLWAQYEFREIAGTIWLVVGVGSIGREVAVRARAFGATVIGVRRNPRGDEPVDEMLHPDACGAALPRADVVALCADANPTSERLVNRGFLAAMKPGSILVNIARGSLVDEPALLASLDRGVPRLAILDVFESEPLSEDSPFWNHPRVRITGHCAAAGSGSTAREDRIFLANLERYVAGHRLERVVSRR